MATATAERSRTLSSATAIPKEARRQGEDGFPVRMWEVNGEPVAFSLRPFTDEEKAARRYWNPQGAMAPMWWRSQEMNQHGLQPIIQRECWIDGSYTPRNAWEEHMVIEWLAKSVAGGSAGPKWVGNDNPKNTPGEPPTHYWVCGECGWACGIMSCLEQHLLTKSHKGLASS